MGTVTYVPNVLRDSNYTTYFLYLDFSRVCKLHEYWNNSWIALHVKNAKHSPKVYLTSPEPSKNCYNFLILHPILKTLTPL